MIIIGITGTLGAGKGTIVDYLVEHYHFLHFSVRKYLTEILESKGIEPNRDEFTILANSLRATNNSPSFLIEELYKSAQKTGKNSIIESIRTVGEIDNLKKLGRFYLIAVDADLKERYHRITTFRKSETDNIDFETFKSNEEREFVSDDPNNQNLSACIERADFIVYNNGTSEDLKVEIDRIMSNILKDAGEE